MLLQPSPAPFIPYAAVLALWIERAGSSWPAIAVMVVLMLTAPSVWMLFWKWTMQLMVPGRSAPIATAPP